MIFAFHVVGTFMELFKTAAGRWIYSEEALLRIRGVPLFSGFMYAAVGSYIARVWRIFDFRFTRFPPLRAAAALAAGIYVNFFNHHRLPDARVPLLFLTLFLFGRTFVWFKPYRRHRVMPLLLGFLLLALFIWFAENIGTFARACAYPGQQGGWAMVSPHKLVAWYLLMMISLALVALVRRPKPLGERPLAPAGGAG